jgi:hypothetical protein
MACRWTSRYQIKKLKRNLTDLDETGRLHFFYHSPSSSYPVRDVLNEQGHGYKTEPYIEMRHKGEGAENYCCECNQMNIRGFLRGRQKYLFLLTTCRNEKLKHSGAVCIVGYIVKERCELRPGGFYAVVGRVRLFSFDDAIRLGESASDNNPRQMKKMCDAKRTRSILHHFKGKKNILRLCRKAVELLKKRLPEQVRKEQMRKCR